MPHPSTSNHPVFWHTRHPLLVQKTHPISTSADGSETISPDLEAQIEIKETEGEEVVTEELEEEEEGSLPGFGAFASLLALTFIVLTRRKD